MSRSKPILIILVLLPIISAQGSPVVRPESPGLAGTPSLAQLYGDLGELLRSTDRDVVKALEARLLETGEEIRLLESLRSTLGRGILVDIPKVLRESTVDSASPELLAKEEEAVSKLRADLEIAKAKQQRLAKASERKEESRAKGASVFALATIQVAVEVPIPPKSAAGSISAVSSAVDPEGVGRALYAAKDHLGALNAFTALPEGERTLEVQCLMARCLEHVGRWEEAKVLYTKVSEKDPTGSWGSMARWMLRFGEHLRSASALSEVRSGSQGEQK